MSETTFIFLDTNIYLHYQPFDQIDWLKVTKASSIRIIIPPITIHELNSHKDSPSRNKQVKTRAGKVISRLTKLFKDDSIANIRDNVDIQLEDREPDVDFTDLQLKHEVQDDQLIANMVMYQNLNPGSRIALVTSDSGLVLLGKARRLGIETIELPDKYKLQEEPDADKKRIKELEQQVFKLENQQPKLSLAFDESGNERLEVTLEEPIVLSSEEIDKQLEELKERYPKYLNLAQNKRQIIEGQ